MCSAGSFLGTSPFSVSTLRALATLGATMSPWGTLNSMICGLSLLTFVRMWLQAP